MSVTLIIPAASDLTIVGSTGERLPVWLATRPDAVLTLCSVIQDLDLSAVGRIVIVVKRSHVDKFCKGKIDRITTAIVQNCPAVKANQLHFVQLEHDTNDAVETVCAAIDVLKITGPIYIKDCDGASPIKVTGENSVAVYRVSTATGNAVHNLPSKSFAETCGNIITNIKEKHIISDTICVGGYGFDSAATFVEAVAAVRSARDEHDSMATAQRDECGNRVFVSHIVFHLIVSKGVVFVSQFVDRLEDWKSESGWRAFCATYRNVMVLFEGILAKRKDPADVTSELSTASPVEQAFEPNTDVVQQLQKLHKSGRVRLTILSTRSADGRAELEALLRRWNVPFDAVLTSQFHVDNTLVVANSHSLNQL